MKIEPIPGFSALQMKDEVQREVQAELEDLTPEERIQKLRDFVENGPMSERWRQMRPPRWSPDSQTLVEEAPVPSPSARSAR